ncbi:hypothetical protein HPB50_017838 [Hyalomma asiaticum]|uniref:Uncharacterized protein n=1 Tax=Hyalomma asiaticum TaxID=266040 RepID=A0ACB7TJX2_HYAAI|nr:hypothetical protein HPB50_017838 [Hyalomma asiaticum]
MDSAECGRCDVRAMCERLCDCAKTPPTALLRRLNTKPKRGRGYVRSLPPPRRTVTPSRLSNHAQPSHLAQSTPEPLCSHSATQECQRIDVPPFVSLSLPEHFPPSARFHVRTCVRLLPARRNAMPGIVWQNLDPVTMSRLGVDLIREELARRQLDITGSKEELFQRLQAAIQQQHEATPSSLAMLFQQLPRPATTVTTLPDLSSSIPQFAGLHSHSVNTWLDDVRRAQKIDYLLHGLREQHILAAIAANRPPTVAEFISTCTSLDKSAQHLHAKASPSPFAGSVLLPLQPFRAAKPAERQQLRSEQSTPQSSQGATPKMRISELPAEQQEATYAAISAHCLSSSAPPTMPKTQQPPALHSAPVTLDGSQQQCPFFSATLSGVDQPLPPQKVKAEDEQIKEETNCGSVPNNHIPNQVNLGLKKQ